MEYAEGIKINGIHSFIDYDLTIASRKIDLPPKTSIRKTVPFMNGYYDYSKINGAICWGERQIQYTFDIIGETVEQMDLKRTEVVNWLCNLHDVDIYDDTIPDYHFHGSFDNISQNEDGEKSELTVTFICHPFMIENQPRIIYTNGNDATITANNIGQSVKPIIETAQDCTVTIGNRMQSVSAGETKLAMMLQNGETEVRITKDNELKYPYAETTHTESGITFTVNADGTIVANGTATDVSWFYLRSRANNFKPPNGYHLLSGCPAGGGDSTYRIQVFAYYGEEKGSVYTYDNGEGGTIVINDDTVYLSIAIRISAGVTVNNLVFKPALYGETKLKWFSEVL